MSGTLYNAVWERTEAGERTVFAEYVVEHGAVYVTIGDTLQRCYNLLSSLLDDCGPTMWGLVAMERAIATLREFDLDKHRWDGLMKKLLRVAEREHRLVPA